MGRGDKTTALVLVASIPLVPLATRKAGHADVVPHRNRWASVGHSVKRTRLKRRTPLRNRGRIRPKTKAQRDAKRATSKRAWAYLPCWLAEVRAMACAECHAAAPSDPAHVRWMGSGGASMKPADCWVIPLCRRCHDEQHAGRRPDSSRCHLHLLFLLRRTVPEAPPLAGATEREVCEALAKRSPGEVL